jgi:prophage regulatory protein
MSGTKQQTPIDRAKAHAEQTRAQYEEWRRRPSYLHLSAQELIAIAESGKVRGGADLEALDEAWCQKFGEPLCGPGRPSEPKAESEPEPADDTMLDIKEVARITGLSKSTVNRMVDDGRFPRPVKLSPRRIGWPAVEVKAWVEDKDLSRRKRRV